MAQKAKIASYLGFARRAGKLTLGVNGVAAVRSGVYLLVCDKTASANTKKEVEKLQKRFGCPVVYVENLGEQIGAVGRMVCAVREEHLAIAIQAACKE